MDYEIVKESGKAKMQKIAIMRQVCFSQQRVKKIAHELVTYLRNNLRIYSGSRVPAHCV